ncbi:MAG: BatA domain-containing protein [Phycisphaerales bacterium]
MSFISPWLAVAGAAAMALPILIHLFLRRRQKPIEWAAMELLRRAVQQSQRTKRVERWILLVVRCLLLLLVGLALGRPATVTAIDATQPLALAVVLDDGAASMVSSGTAGTTAFEASRQACIDAIRALPVGSVVHVFTTSGLIQHTTDAVQPDRAVSLLADLGPTYEPSRMRQAVDRADDALRRLSMPSRIIVASPFTRGAIDTEAQVLPATAATLEVRKVDADDASTTAIVSVVQRTLGPQVAGAITLDVTVVRPVAERGRRSVPVTVTDAIHDRTTVGEAVFIEGAPRAVATVSLQVDPSATEHAVVASIPADRQPADDTRAATVSTVSAKPVILLDRERLDIDEGSSAQWIERALEPIPGLGLSHRRLDPAGLREGSLQGAASIVVCRPELLEPAGWVECTRACEAGALVLMVPPTEDTFVDWQAPCAALLGDGVTIRREVARHDPARRLAPQQPSSPITQLIAAELPELVGPVMIDRSIVMEGPATTLSNVLVMDDGQPWMVMSIRQRGVAILLASPPVPSWGSIATKPLFVPLVQETIRQGEVLLDAGQGVTIGAGRLTPGVTELRPVHGASMGDAVLTVDPSGSIVGEGARPGIMQAISPLGTTLIALNVDASACDPQPNDPLRLAAWLNQTKSPDAGGASTVSTKQASSSASVWLLAAAALVLLAETLLGRLFSVAEPKPS